MAGLTINGWEVEVAFDGSDGDVNEVGERSRSEDASLGLSRIALKDSLDLKTIWLRRETAAALRGLILGRGHRFAFENNGDVTGDIVNALYSSGKLGPVTNTGTALRVAEVIAESTSSEFDSDKFGSCALAAESAGTNMLSANQSNIETDATEFTNVAGGTRARDTTVFRQGVASLKVTYTAAGDGVKTNATSATATTAYVASVYLRANSGTPDVDVYLRDEVNATPGTTKTVRLSTTQWKRVEVRHTTGGGAPTLSVYILKNGAGANSFYIDQLQLQTEVVSSLAYGTSWVVGAGTKSATELKYYMGGLRKHDDLTVMFWTRGPANGGGDGAYAFVLGDASNQIAFRVDADPRLEVKVSGTLQSGVTSSNSFSVGAWVHIACVMRRNPQTGSSKLELYWNGVKEVASPASLPDFTSTGAFPHLWVGTDQAAVSHWNGLIDELVVVPYGMTSSMISAVYQSAFSDLPKLNVAGDIIGSTCEMLGAEVSRSHGSGYPTGATACELMERLGFKLEEV